MAGELLNKDISLDADIVTSQDRSRISATVLIFFAQLFRLLRCTNHSFVSFPISHRPPQAIPMVSPLWKACSEGDLQKALDVLTDATAVDIEVKGTR